MRWYLNDTSVVGRSTTIEVGPTWSGGILPFGIIISDILGAV